MQTNDNARRQSDAERRQAELMQQKAANAAAFAEVVPVVAAWARGEGSAAELKRFGRRQELKLLVQSGVELATVSTFAWTQFMTSGLQPAEVSPRAAAANPAASRPLAAHLPPHVAPDAPSLPLQVRGVQRHDPSDAVRRCERSCTT